MAQSEAADRNQRSSANSWLVQQNSSCHAINRMLRLQSLIGLSPEEERGRCLRMVRMEDIGEGSYGGVPLAGLNVMGLGSHRSRQTREISSTPASATFLVLATLPAVDETPLRNIEHGILPSRPSYSPTSTMDGSLRNLRSTHNQKDELQLTNGSGGNEHARHDCSGAHHSC